MSIETIARRYAAALADVVLPKGETATATFGSAIAIGCTAIAETGLE